MKGNVRKSFLLVVLVTLVFAGVANTQETETTMSAKKSWSALESPSSRKNSRQPDSPGRKVPSHSST